MLRLDRNDPLDRMILKELSGTPVPFDEWLDAMEDLEDEPDCDQILKERGLCKENVLRDAVACCVDFRARLADAGLPDHDRFALCRMIAEQAQAAPCEELLSIYCEVLCGSEFLLDPETHEDEEQAITEYLDFLEERDVLLQTLLQRKELAVKFEAVKTQKRSPRPADCATERKYEIFRCFTSLLDLPQKGDGRILLDNLAVYMQTAAASPILKSVEPLLIFRLLTRRQSYMCHTPGLAVNLSALWKADNNKIDVDNGRNFKQYRVNLQLFIGLCKIYEEDNSVNIPLCWYGLDQITVLGDFYRNEISKGWEYADDETEPPFVPTIEELVEDSLFSCFANGHGDNVTLQNSGLRLKELLRFQYSPNLVIISSLEKISDYMNNHALRLTETFLYADPAKVRRLCRNILEHANIRHRYSPHDLSLYLASINNGLMDLQDYFASQYLIEAGHLLTDAPLTKNPTPIE